MNLDPLLSAVPGARAVPGFGLDSVEVPAGSWQPAVRSALEDLGCSVFDFLSAVDEPEGPRMLCHLVRPDPFGHLVLRTRLRRADPVVTSVAGVFAGAGWHERETAEMFGIAFLDAEGRRLDLPPLLLPPGFAGHPLRKDVGLPARDARTAPGDVARRA